MPSVNKMYEKSKRSKQIKDKSSYKPKFQHKTKTSTETQKASLFLTNYSSQGGQYSNVREVSELRLL